MKTALITGITGQDGSYLAELLLSEGYEVYGIIRRHSFVESQQERLKHLTNKITTFYGDLLDKHSLYSIINQVNPDEIYNLAAQSHVKVSSDLPEYTMQVNAMGVLYILECVKTINPTIKIYQASSSEMFGNSVDPDGYQRETTPMNPVSPYGCSKVAAYNLCEHYKKAYNMFVVNGILFNHESPRRGITFVTNKIIKGALDIKNGKTDKLILGNASSSRDWGHAKDYTKAMYLMLQQDTPENFVIATGQTNSVEKFCELVFAELSLDYKKYVEFNNTKYLRPEELFYLRGDNSKAKSILKWEPKYNLESLIQDMLKTSGDAQNL